MVIACSICSKKFQTVRGLRSHKWRAHTDEGQSHKPIKPGTRSAWNKGLTKCNDERVAKNSVNAGLSRRGRPGHAHTLKTKMEISERMSGNNNGGRCKWFTVDNKKVQGTWEFNFAIELNRRNIDWEPHPKPPWKFFRDGKECNYTPDFYIKEDDLFLELKGYWWGNDKEKMNLISEQHSDKNLLIIEKEDYERFLRGELVW